MKRVAAGAVRKNLGPDPSMGRKVELLRRLVSMRQGGPKATIGRPERRVLRGRPRLDPREGRWLPNAPMTNRPVVPPRGRPGYGVRPVAGGGFERVPARGKRFAGRPGYNFGPPEA